jgi:hypothetical protein
MWEEQEKFVLGDYEPKNPPTFETYVAMVSGEVVMSYEPDLSCGMYDNLLKAYNLGVGSKRARVNSREEEPELVTGPAKAKGPKQRRTPQALVRLLISIKELLNSLEITISLT